MASLAEAIYDRSPVWLQQAETFLWGIGWFHRRFSSHFHRHVKGFKERDRWDASGFRLYQEQMLARILEAARRAPYYRHVFQEAGVTPAMATWEAFSRLPVLDRETLALSGRDLLTVEKIPRGTQIIRTSGTSGTPKEIYFTREFHGCTTACSEVRSLNMHGVHFRDRRVMFGARRICRFEQARPPFWRVNPVENMAYASIYHLAPQWMPSYVDFLRKYKPAVIMGYPNELRILAQFVLEGHLELPPARVVVTMAETLTAETRHDLESAWNCKVADRYGSVEGCGFAGQCREGRYHVSPDMGIFEIVNADGSPAAPGELGEVVLTGLHNSLQPLIRYRPGDTTRWAKDQNCPCGRHMPVIEGIEGRMEDICITRDRRRIQRLDPVFKGLHHIREAQVVQDDVDLFTVNVSTDGRFRQEDAQELTSRLQLYLGNVKVQIKEMKAIPRDKSGKFRPVVCRLSPQQKETLLNP